jgi:hypothetical protein
MSFIPTMIMLLIITAICYVIIKITEALNKDEQETMTTNDVVIKSVKIGIEHPLSDRIREYPITPSEAFEIPLDKYKVGATFKEAKTIYEGKYPIDEPGINYPAPEKNIAIAGIMQSIKERAEIIEASKTDQERELENKISQLTEEERGMLQQIINRHNER